VTLQKWFGNNENFKNKTAIKTKETEFEKIEDMRIVKKK